MLVCLRLKLSNLLCQISQIGLHPLKILLNLWLIHVGTYTIQEFIVQTLIRERLDLCLGFHSSHEIGVKFEC
jgi:hypothetical protein